MIVIGIDPATGVSSDLGYCAFNPETLEILATYNIGSSYKKLEHRIKEISDVVEALLIELPPEEEVLVCIEYFVMAGKNGETLQRLVGSIMGRVPYNQRVVSVQNSTVKLMMAGHGHADKLAVAFGTHKHFESNKKSAERIIELTRGKEFDILDSIAIGVTGWLKRNELAKVKKPKKYKKAR